MRHALRTGFGSAGCGLVDGVGNVGWRQACGHARQRRRDGHAVVRQLADVEIEQLLAVRQGGQSQPHQQVEAPWPPHCWVDVVLMVGGRHDHHVAQAVEAVHFDPDAVDDAVEF